MRLVFDFETTGAQRNKGHPFDYLNKACCVGFLDIDTGEVYEFKIEYDEEPYGENLQAIQGLLDRAEVLIGVNLKFDFHWLRRYGLHFDTCPRIFDCQLAFFILRHQVIKYPSLNGMAEHYGLEKKYDEVKEEYWNKGLDTDQVPYTILSKYLIQDLQVTKNVYLAILKEMENASYMMRKLISISMHDLVVLEDIEWNGLLYDKTKSIRIGNELEKELESLASEVRSISGEDWLNINSGDHLSWFLYGGTLLVDGIEEFEFVYKDGRKVTKTRKAKLPRHRRGLFAPLEGTELSKSGFYSTDVATLQNLSERASGEASKVIDLLLTISKLEKQRNTYFHGFPKTIEKMNWRDDVIHSSFNQNKVVSGRLSSDKPNVQNLQEAVKVCIISKYRVSKKCS